MSFNSSAYCPACGAVLQLIVAPDNNVCQYYDSSELEYCTRKATCEVAYSNISGMSTAIRNMCSEHAVAMTSSTKFVSIKRL